MTDLSERWALVTGGSSGFGVEFAELLAGRKLNLVLAARRTEPMQMLAEELRRRHSVKVAVETIDLSQPGAGAEIKARTDSRGTPIDVLVNNAGYGMYGSFIEQPLEKITDMVQVNIVALTELTYLFAHDMVERRRGYILLTASLLGYQAVPGYAAYAATKAYVLLLGEALHRELKPFGVSVTALCPGSSATGFIDVAGQGISPYLKPMMTTPRNVAQTGIAAMFAQRSTSIPGLLNKAAVFSERLLPRSMHGMIVGKVISG
jgi:short-subunit dehydrogenase